MEKTKPPKEKTSIWRDNHSHGPTIPKAWITSPRKLQLRFYFIFLWSTGKDLGHSKSDIK